MSHAMPGALRYHSYLLEKSLPFLHGPVWEIGMGYGQYTEMLLSRDFPVLATEIDQELLDRANALKARFPKLLSTEYVDLTQEETVEKCARYVPRSVICFNVLEHIRDDLQALRWIYKSLPSSANVVFITPAHQSLFGFMDQQAGHFRRYTRSTLKHVFVEAGFRVRETRYINPIGAIGWFWRNRCSEPRDNSLNSNTVNSEIQFFDRYLVPPTKLLEPLFSKLFGLSVFLVATKD